MAHVVSGYTDDLDPDQAVGVDDVDEFRAAITRRVILKNEGSRLLDMHVRGKNEILRYLRMTHALQPAVGSSRLLAPAAAFSAQPHTTVRQR